MSFQTLKKEVERIATDANGKVSLFISTDEGDIKINEADQMKAASIIKVPMVMAGLYQHDQEGLDLTEKVTTKEPVGGCGVLQYFSETEKLSLLSVMKLAIIVSDNTASNIVMDVVGIDQINDYMTKVGAEDTILGRKFMDLEAAGKGLENVTSARDMMMFLKMIHQDTPYLSPANREVLFKILGQQQLNHKLPFYQSAFPDKEIMIAHKTGEITGVEHDVGIFTNGRKTVYATVLTSDWQYNYEGQQTIAQIGESIMAYM